MSAQTTTVPRTAAAPAPIDLVTQEVEAVNAECGVNPIDIGILSPMTQPGDAMAGVLVARGARLGAEYLRERGGVLGGRNVRLVAADDMATAEQDGFNGSAVARLAKLAMVDEVVAVLGQWHLRTTKWTVPLCEALGLPMFVENGYSEATHRRRAIFRTYFSIADRAPLMMDCLASIGAKRIGVLASDTVFGSEMADELQAYGKKNHGMQFLRFDFAQQEVSDWRDSLKAIADWNPDAFINGGVNVSITDSAVGNTYHILEQAIEVGLLPGVPMMVTFGFPTRSADYWRMAGQDGNGVMWAASRYRPSWPGLTPIGHWFTDRFVQRYGTLPPDTCLSAFTDVTIIGQALEQAGEYGREPLLAALESGTFDTWRGPLSFERGEQHWHHNPPELVVHQYQSFGQTFDEAAIIYPGHASDRPYAAPAALPGSPEASPDD